MNDPYEELGVDRDATSDEINKAFRKKAKKVHPDGGGTPEEFERVKRASMVLLDPAKRKKFDEDGTVGDDAPDNDAALAMERVASFFINSINATTQEGFGVPSLDEVDLVQGAMVYFSQQIGAAQNNINRVQRQVKQFTKAMSRIKTKRADDVLTTMLKKYAHDLDRNIEHNKKDIKINEMAKEIVRDYEFIKADDPPTPTQRLLHPYANQYQSPFFRNT